LAIVLVFFNEPRKSEFYQQYNLLGCVFHFLEKWQNMNDEYSANRYLVFHIIRTNIAVAIMLQKCLQYISFPGSELQMLIYSLPSAWF